MRNSIFILSVLFCLPLLALGSEANDMMILHMKDSSVKYFKLASKPEVTFNGTELMIFVPDTRTQCCIEADDVMHFSFGSSAGIANPAADAVTVSFDDCTLTVKGLSAGDNLCVYNLSGIEVGRSAADANGVAVLDISALPNGVYAGKTSGLSFKIYRQ